MLAQDERLLAALVQPQRAGFAQIDSIMRGVKRFDDLRVRVSRTNPLGQSPTARRAIAPFRQHDPEGLKQRRRPRQIIFQKLIDHGHRADPALPAYFSSTRNSAKYVWASALVQRPIFPASGKVTSLASRHGLPSR